MASTPTSLVVSKSGSLQLSMLDFRLTRRREQEEQEPCVTGDVYAQGVMSMTKANAKKEIARLARQILGKDEDGFPRQATVSWIGSKTVVTFNGTQNEADRIQRYIEVDGHPVTAKALCWSVKSDGPSQILPA